MKKHRLFRLTLVLLVCSCSSNQHKTSTLAAGKESDTTTNQTATSNQPVSSDDKTASTAGGCNDALWKQVYDPSRLQVLDKCKVVTGVIEESNADEDGDQHMLLKLDKGQKDLLTKRNEKKKQGDLVIEVVCANKITRKKAMGACTGYTNNISLPAVGDHVRVTGSYVIDSHNGWAEIHPVSKIEKMK